MSSKQVAIPEGQLMVVEETRPTFTCEFCRVSFKCDIDVSRHLENENHKKNKEEFMNHLGQNVKTTDKYSPKDLSHLLKSLKLRSVKDLKDLADKGYFEIKNDRMAEIAEELAKILVKAVIEHDAQELPPGTRTSFLEIFKAKESANDRNQPSSSVSLNPAPGPSTSSSSRFNKENTLTNKGNQPNKQAIPPKQNVNLPKQIVTSKKQSVTQQTPASKQPTKTTRNPTLTATPTQPIPSSSRLPTPMPNKQRSSSSSSSSTPSSTFKAPTPVEPPKNQTNPSQNVQHPPNVPQSGVKSTYTFKFAKIKVEPKDS